MKKNIIKTLAIPIACGLITIGIFSSNVSLAYLTDRGNTLKNSFTIALDATSEIKEKFDPPTSPDTPNFSYEKQVQIHNTGYIDEYVRVRLDFSSSNVEKITKVSSDGTHYYTLSDFKKHLPTGWKYDESISGEGFYYYTPILETGSDITTDSKYNAKSITTPLIKSVQTNFGTFANMESYDIYVSNESCPFYLGTNYKTAWTAYLSQE